MLDQSSRVALLVAGLVLASAATTSAGDADSMKAQPRVIHLDRAAGGSRAVFTGPPVTWTMRSGYVVLQPGTSVGRHNTRRYEEAVVVLEGAGEMRITGGATLELAPYTVAYCPPMTEHDVFNTGRRPLRYIWLVAKVQP